MNNLMQLQNTAKDDTQQQKENLEYKRAYQKAHLELAQCNKSQSYFNQLTIKQLKQYCRQHQISNYSNKCKHKIIELIMANVTHNIKNKQHNKQNQTKSKQLSNDITEILHNTKQLSNGITAILDNKYNKIEIKLNRKKMQELRQLCKKFGINIQNKKTKQKIIDCILNAVKNNIQLQHNVYLSIMDAQNNISATNKHINTSMGDKLQQNNNINTTNTSIVDKLQQNNNISATNTTKLIVNPQFYSIDSDDDYYATINDKIKLNSAFCDISDENVDNISINSFDMCWN